MTILFSDSFTNTTGTELSAHNAAWVNRTRNGAENCLITNAGRVRGPLNTNEYYNTTSPSSADYTVEADIVFVTAPAGGLSVSIFGRASTTYTSAYTAGLFTASGLRLYRQLSGSFLQLSTTYAFSPVAGTTYNIKLEMIANVIKVYLDGVLRINVTNSEVPATQNKAGIRFANLSAGTSTDSVFGHLDNFTISQAGLTLAGSPTVDANSVSTGALPQHIVTAGAATADAGTSTGGVLLVTPPAFLAHRMMALF